MHFQGGEEAVEGCNVDIGPVSVNDMLYETLVSSQELSESQVVVVVGAG